ncbi:MAG: acetyl-CoA acetyltransferase [Alphaproteobacteria bacterium]|nr:acetyl-CoA acetyltransferase [Alphaproteobacteria bacterium]
MSVSDTTPVLVGCGDITDQKTPVEAARSPYDLMAEAGRAALADTGSGAVGAAIEAVAVVRLFAETSHRFRSGFGSSANPPASLARRLGLRPSRLFYTWSGGNMPQSLVNRFAVSIARGEIRSVLIAGGEALRTQRGLERAGLAADWREDPGGAPELIGDPRPGYNAHEEAHGLSAAIAFYPLIETAIRAARGASPEAHLAAMAALMARLSSVAAANPLATRRELLSAARLARIDGGNRWIGYPYPRLMTSNAYVDQAAALVMMSAGLARSLGIPSARWVHLHGCADCHDHWSLLDRPELHRSPAIRAGLSHAMAMAGRRSQDMAYLDLYSCFPSAIEVACAEAGLAEDDARGLTVTGGLPCFGGPGNNYVTHSIAETMRRLRAAPGRFGLVSANGYYLTKHAFGIYSTSPPEHRPDYDSGGLQAELDGGPKAPFTQEPSGAARIESYAVMHATSGPALAIIVGREEASGRRFLANLDDGEPVPADMQQVDWLGRTGHVRRGEGRNLFAFA